MKAPRHTKYAHYGLSNRKIESEKGNPVRRMPMPELPPQL